MVFQLHRLHSGADCEHHTLGHQMESCDGEVRPSTCMVPHLRPDRRGQYLLLLLDHHLPPDLVEEACQRRGKEVEEAHLLYRA